MVGIRNAEEAQQGVKVPDGRMCRLGATSISTPALDADDQQDRSTTVVPI